MAPQSQKIILDVDARIVALVAEINATPKSGASANFVDDFQGMLADKLLGPFGLSRSMFSDVDGGAVTSLRNFEKGVVANDADAARHKAWKQAQTEVFDRGDYDKALNNAGFEFKAPDGKEYDAYSGRKVPEGPRTTARDHVQAASTIERSSKGHLAQTRQERVATATLEENVVLTTTAVNCSKRDSDLIEWMGKPSKDDPSKTNAEYYDLDVEKAKAAYEKAVEAIDATQDAAVFRKQAGEVLVEGGKSAGKLALRQVLGLVLHDLIQGVVADIRHLTREGYENLGELAALAERRVRATWERIRQRWAEYLKEGVSAGLSGFLSTVVTLLINAVVTTVKNVVAMIREGVLAFARAVKAIVAPAPGATKADTARQVAGILAGAVATCVGIALEEVIAKALQATPLAPVAATVAPVIAGIISGALALLALLAFDRLRNHIEFRNKALADVHRGHAVTVLRIQQTAVMLDDARHQMDAARDAMAEEARESDRQHSAARADTDRAMQGYGAALSDLKLTFGIAP